MGVDCGVTMRKLILFLLLIVGLSVSVSAFDNIETSPSCLTPSYDSNYGLFLITENSVSGGDVMTTGNPIDGWFSWSSRLSNGVNVFCAVSDYTTPGDLSGQYRIIGTSENGLLWYSDYTLTNYSAGTYTPSTPSLKLHLIDTLSATAYRKLTIDSDGNIYTNDGLNIYKYIKSIDYGKQLFYSLTAGVDYADIYGTWVVTIGVPVVYDLEMDSSNNLYVIIGTTGGTDSGTVHTPLSISIISPLKIRIGGVNGIAETTASSSGPRAYSTIYGGGIVLDNVNPQHNYTYSYYGAGGAYLMHNSSTGTINLFGGVLTGISEVSDLAYYNSQIYLASNGQNLIRSYITNYSGYTGTGTPITGMVSFDQFTYSIGDTATVTATLTNPDYINQLYVLSVTGQPSTYCSASPCTKTINSLTAGTYTATISIYGGAVLATATATVGVAGGAPVLVGSDIQWWKASYNVDGTGTFSYQFATDAFDFLESPYIRLYRNNVLLHLYPSDYEIVSKTSGSFSYLFSEPGEYRVDLIADAIYSSERILATDTTTVSIPVNSITSASTVAVGVPLKVSYSFGATTAGSFIMASGADINAGILTKYAQLPCPCTGAGTTNITLTQAGKYKLSLVDSSTFVTLASSTLTVLPLDYKPPAATFATSAINTDFDTYSADSIIFGTYQIDGANFSNYSYYTVSIRSSGGVPIGGYNMLSSANPYGSFDADLAGLASSLFQDGSATISLMAGNSAFGTDTITLATKAITLVAAKGGYLLKVSPKELCVSGNIFVSYSTPTDAVLKMTYFTLTSRWESINYSVYSGNGSKTINIPKTMVQDSSAIMFELGEVSTIVLYHYYDCIPTGNVSGTPIGTGGTGAPGVAPGGLDNPANSNALWGFLLTAFAMGYVAFQTGKHGANPVLPSMIVGVLGLIVFTLVGWFPMWILFTIVLCVIAAVAFKLSEIINTGGG